MRGVGPRVSLYLPVLLGTVREGNRSGWVARYAADRLARRPGVETRLFDPREWSFPNLAAREWEMDPQPPHVAAFVREMARADGFVIVAPEYNHGYPGTLKNMLDALFDEWNRKPFALVGVGGVSGGLRMLEQLRLVVSGLGAVSVPAHVPVPSVAREWTAAGPKEPEKWGERFDKLFVQLEWYAKALKAARQA